MKASQKSIIIYSFLALLIVIPFWRWTLTDWLLTQGDWVMIYPQTLLHHLTLPFIWNWSGLGGINLTASTYPGFLLQALFAKLGFSYPYIERFVYFFPLVITGIIGSYLYFSKIFSSRLTGLIGSIIFNFNTYSIITFNNHVNIINAVSLAPLILFFYEKIFETKRVVFLIVAGLLLFLMSAYEFRVFYIFFFIISGYIFVQISNEKAFSLDRNCLKRILLYFVPLLIALLCNIYWIIGIANTGQIGNNELFNRGLFGTQFFSLFEGLSLHHPFWTGKEVAVFSKEAIPFYFFLIPFLAFLGLITHKPDKRTLFFGFTGLIGILLVKQTSEPFSQLYIWLFDHVPGFNAFREPSKFYFLVILSYAFLISALIKFSISQLSRDSFLWKKLVYGAFFLIAIVLPIINTIPMINGDLDFLFKERKPSKDYEYLNNILLENTDEAFLSLWIPRYSRFGIYDPNRRIESLNKIEKNVLRDWSISEPGYSNMTAYQKYEFLLKGNFLLMLLSDSNIKYVIVPIQDKENNDDIFRYYGGEDNPNIREWYIDQLDALPYLKRIDIGTKELVVYENENYSPYLRAFPTLIGYDSFQNLDEKYTFSSSVLKEDFDFVEHREPLPFPTRGVRHIFENITPANISERGITETFKNVSGNASLYARAPGESVSINDSSVSLLPAERSESFTRFPIETSVDSITITYRDPEKPFSNHIPNPSFEEGLWKEKVGDCNNFDKNGLLDMKRSDEASDGSHALELHATRHIACTNQKFPVSGGRTHLFSFDYQSPNAKQVGFHIGFDGPNKSSVSEKIPLSKKSERGTRPTAGGVELGTNEWFSFTKQITIPDGATTASLTVYSYSTDNETDIVTRYDNFSFIELPDIADRYYLVSDPETNFVEPREITFDLINPTKKLVHIKGATTPFYLAMSESYHPQWQAQFTNGKINGFFRSWIPWVTPDRIPDEHHFELNGFLNGWYIDINDHCKQKNLCTKNADGSYEMELVLEFFPQRWFYLGLLISGTTLLACLGYLGYDFVKRRKNKQLTTN